jgi:hypothetical protein
VEDRRARAGKAGDEDRPANLDTIDLGMTRSSIGDAQPVLEKVQDVVARESSADEVQRTFGLDGVEQSTKRLAKLLAAEIIEPSASASFVEQRPLVESDPGRVADGV